jgi:hypothetical protein
VIYIAYRIRYARRFRIPGFERVENLLMLVNRRFDADLPTAERPEDFERTGADF